MFSIRILFRNIRRKLCGIRPEEVLKYVLAGNLKELKIVWETCGKYDRNAYLVTAVSHNHLNIVNFLLEQGLVEHINTALEIACEKGYREMVQKLLDHGANPYNGIRLTKSPNILSILHNSLSKKGKNS